MHGHDGDQTFMYFSLAHDILNNENPLIYEAIAPTQQELMKQTKTNKTKQVQISQNFIEKKNI